MRTFQSGSVQPKVRKSFVSKLGLLKWFNLLSTIWKYAGNRLQKVFFFILGTILLLVYFKFHFIKLRSMALLLWLRSIGLWYWYLEGKSTRTYLVPIGTRRGSFLQQDLCLANQLADLTAVKKISRKGDHRAKLF